MLELVHHSPRAHGYPESRWTLRRLRQASVSWLKLGIDSSLWHLLRRLDISYKRGRQSIHSPDPDYQAKLETLERYLGHSRGDPRRYPLLYLDELSYYRQPTIAPVYEARGHQQGKARRSQRSNSCRRVVGALDAGSGKVLHHQGDRIGCRELVRFYEQIAQAYPEAESIYLVADNWPVHFHADVMAALVPQTLPFPALMPANWPKAAAPGALKHNLPLIMVQLPTYAPWTNPIEKLWRWLYADVLHMHPFADDLRALMDKVARFLDRFANGSDALLRYTGLWPG
jgi:hypothetical protein